MAYPVTVEPFSGLPAPAPPFAGWEAMDPDGPMRAGDALVRDPLRAARRGLSPSAYDLAFPQVHDRETLAHDHVRLVDDCVLYRPLATEWFCLTVPKAPLRLGDILSIGELHGFGLGDRTHILNRVLAGDHWHGVEPILRRTVLANPTLADLSRWRAHTRIWRLTGLNVKDGASLDPRGFPRLPGNLHFSAPLPLP